MEGIIGVGEAAQETADTVRERGGNGIRYQHEIPRTLPKIQPPAFAVKWLAPCPIQDQEGIEPIQRELRQRIGTSGHHYVEKTMPDQLRRKPDRIGRRRT